MVRSEKLPFNRYCEGRKEEPGKETYILFMFHQLQMFRRNPFVGLQIGDLIDSTDPL